MYLDKISRFFFAVTEIYLFFDALIIIIIFLHDVKKYASFYVFVFRCTNQSFVLCVFFLLYIENL